MNIKRLGLWLIIPLIVMGLAAYWRFFLYPYETTDNCYLKTHMTLVSSRESGYVKEIHFVENQHVTSGDLLVVIDDVDFKARLSAVEANIKVENARIASLETDKKVQTSHIHQQHTEITSAEADLERARRDMQRFANLIQHGAVSSQTHDTASATLKQAVAAHEKSLAALTAAEGELAVLDARIEEAFARISALEAERELARFALLHTRILAPMTGTIGNRSVQIGQLAKPGNPMAYLIPDSDIYIEANFKETQIAFIREGQVVDIEIDAYPNTTFRGHVMSFSPASGSEFSLLPSENATGNFTKIVRRVPIQIAIDQTRDIPALRPGLSATAHIRVH